MNLEIKISECQTVEELTALEGLYILSEFEQRLVFKKKIEIISRLLECGENKHVGLTVKISDSWLPDQRQQLLYDWQNDEPIREIVATEELNNLVTKWLPKEREIFHNWQNDEPLQQIGRGHKRSVDEVNEGASASNEVSDSNYFTVNDLKQVNVKKFRTTSVNYAVQFNDRFADLELYQFHNQL